ncbi:unnamed protein product [Boreogadus saida]
MFRFRNSGDIKRAGAGPEKLKHTLSEDPFERVQCWFNHADQWPALLERRPKAFTQCTKKHPVNPVHRGWGGGVASA